MKEKFKEFVKANPKLIDYVKNNNKSWQELYEIYALYGDDSSVWDNYMKNNKTGLDELIKMIQGVNLDSVKKTIDSIQKAVTIIQNIGPKDNNLNYEKTREYEDLND